MWDGLDWVLAKHAAMVLMRGGSSKGAEFVASRWADAHNVTEMIFLRVGLVTAKRRRSSATMSFCRRFRSASSRSPAAAYREPRRQGARTRSSGLAGWSQCVTWASSSLYSVSFATANVLLSSREFLPFGRRPLGNLTRRPD
ncbi:MAG: SLOG family protein [Roseiarcus sp.]